MARVETLVRNSVAQNISLYTNIIIYLFLTPYVANKLGANLYGLWALIVGTTLYFEMLDFGFISAYPKFIAEFYAKKDYSKINQVLSIGILYNFLISFLIIILIFWKLDFVSTTILKISPHMRADSDFVLIVWIVAFGLSQIFKVFQGLLEGIQRFDLTAIVGVCTSILRALAMFLVLIWGFGIKGIVFVAGITMVGSGLISGIVSYKLIPQISLNPFRKYQKEIFKTFSSFCFTIYLRDLVARLRIFLIPLIINYFLGLSFVGFYSLGQKIIGYLQGSVIAMLGVALPAASDLAAHKEFKKIKMLFYRGTKYMMFLATPLLFFTVAVSKNVAIAWLGPIYEQVGIVIVVFAIISWSSLLTGFGTTICKGLGKPKYELFESLINTLLIISLSIVLIKSFGFMGVLAAIIAVSLIAHAAFLCMFNRYIFKIHFIRLFKTSIIQPVTYSFILGIGSFFLARYILILEMSRWTHLFLLGILAVVYGSMYIFVMSRTHFFDEYDYQIMDRIKILKKVEFIFKK